MDELAQVFAEALSEAGIPTSIYEGRFVFLQSHDCAEFADVAKVMDAVRAYLASDSVVERAVAAMCEDPFCDDVALIGTTQQEERMKHYARAALTAATKGDGDGA